MSEFENNYFENVGDGHEFQDEIIMGEVTNSYDSSESVSGYFSVDVKIRTGGNFKQVLYNGWIGFDYNTKNAHGIWIPPREGQPVLISFYKKHEGMPIMLTAVPMGNTVENNELAKEIAQQLKKDEILIQHFDGAKIVIKSDGLEIRKGDKVILINATGVFLGKDGNTPDLAISTTKLKAYLLPILGNLGAPIFSTVTAADLSFESLFGDI